MSDVEETAEADAEALGGRQRYVLRAQVKGKELGSLVVRYDIRADGAAVDSEPPTTAGVVAMLQRHAEGATRMLLQGIGTIVDSLKAQIVGQNELLAEYQRQALSIFRVQEDLATRKTEREILVEEKRVQLEIEAAKANADIERRTKLLEHGLGQLQHMLPALLFHLTGGKMGVPPSEVAAQAQAAQREEMFANLTEERIGVKVGGDLQGLIETLTAHPTGWCRAGELVLGPSSSSSRTS